MDIKKKLMELLDGMFNGECCIDKTEAADFLIANGMTVARHGQWIYNIESGEYVCSACGENALSFRKDTLYDGVVFLLYADNWNQFCKTGTDIDKNTGRYFGTGSVVSEDLYAGDALCHVI